MITPSCGSVVSGYSVCAATVNNAGKVQLFLRGKQGVYTCMQLSKDQMLFGDLQPCLGIGTQLVVASNSDLSLELFYVGADNNLYHKRQSTDGIWGAEKQIGSPFLNGKESHNFCVGTNADGRLEVFYIQAGDYTIHHAWQTTPAGEFGDAVPLIGGAGGVGRSDGSMAVARNGDGRLEIFHVGIGGLNLWHRYQVEAGGAWGDEFRLPDDSQSDGLIAVGQNKDGRLELFYRGSYGYNLWHQYQDAGGTDGWSNQSKISADGTQAGTQVGSMAVALNSSGQFELSYTRSNNLYYVAQQPDAGNGWSNQAEYDYAPTHVLYVSSALELKDNNGQIQNIAIFFGTSEGTGYLVR